MPQADSVFSTPPETYEPFATPRRVLETLVRIERIGSCRRLVFAVTDHGVPGRPARAVVAKLVVPAELMAEPAQMIAADRPEPGAAFARLPIDAVAHRGDGVMKIETWHRRQALMLASELPEGRDDALAVLDCVRELVATFLQSDTPEPAKAPVVTFIRPRPDLSA